MAHPSTSPSIHPFKLEDCKEITDLFHGAVHSISPDFYSKEQLEAWAPTPPNYSKWQIRLEKTQPFVARIDEVIVGFIELELEQEKNGHIDCLYVHKDYQRQGIANALFAYASKDAIKNGCHALYVEASHLAKGFFLQQGFVVEQENIVERNQQKLVNYTMRGELSSSNESSSHTYS